MHCGVSDWIMEQKKGASEKTDEICMKSVVQLTVMSQCSLLTFDKCNMVMQYINIRGNFVKSIWELFANPL